MNASLPNHSKGFTLIELLVVMSIIAILGGGIIPSFSRYLKDQNLKQAQEQLKSDLRTVQNRALTGALSDATVGTPEAPVLYWGISFQPPFDNSGTSTYRSFVSNSASSCPPSSKIDQGTYTLKNNIKCFGPSVCLFFSIKNGDLIRVGGFDNYIDLKYSASDFCGPGGKNCQRVNFNSSGLIY